MSNIWFATISDETSRNFHIFSSKTHYTWTVWPVSICKSSLQNLHVNGNSSKNSKPKEHNKDQSTCTATSHARIFAQTWRFLGRRFWEKNKRGWMSLVAFTGMLKIEMFRLEDLWNLDGLEKLRTWMIWINVLVMITETVFHKSGRSWWWISQVSCSFKICFHMLWQLVFSTHPKNISQIGSFPQVGVKIKNLWNHHLVWCISRCLY